MNIYVGNLVFDVSEDDLREAFEQFGEITEVRLIMDKFSGKSKGFGFIEMPSKDEALKAIEEMNGKEFKGRDLNVGGVSFSMWLRHVTRHMLRFVLHS